MKAWSARGHFNGGWLVTGGLVSEVNGQFRHRWRASASSAEWRSSWFSPSRGPRRRSDQRANRHTLLLDDPPQHRLHTCRRPQRRDTRRREYDRVIRFEDVTKLYANQTRPALDGVSLEIEKGEFVFLVGASGSGKSTCLRLIIREERATGGNIHVAGKDLARLSQWKTPAFRRRIGTVFQDFRLLPNKTVGQNVAFALEVIGKPTSQVRRVVPEVLDLVGLQGKHDRMPDELSGGEQQRVAIARAFVNRPMILIADEPTGNLDPTTSVGIMKLLDRINRTGTTVLMATHDAAIVDQMRKRVIELEGGHLVRDQSRGVYGYAR
jgi:cell division transport system ATP-binding protein